jgi:FAD/FMN-containing dehydrogenase
MAANRNEPTRRAFLGAAGAVTVTGLMWTPAFRVSPAAADSASAPTGFPAGVEVYQQAYSNWADEIVVDAVWTCAPHTDTDVVAIVNWAYANGWRVRPAGMRHGWAPLTVPPGTPTNIVLVDMTQYLTAVTVHPGDPAGVTAQTGVTMETLLTDLENAGYGVTNTPAPGDLSLGGVLAIDGHGTSIPANGETPLAGHTFGSISNLILSLTAVVWDDSAGAYALRRFDRTEPDTQALMAHLGRSFVTEATLRVGVNRRLRCQSFTDVPVETLFAPPASAGPKSFASYVEQAGRAETIWFPFTPAPWLKVWTDEPVKPPLSRETDAPYNYLFADIVTEQESLLFRQILDGVAAAGPELSALEYTLASAGLISTDTFDLWGWSKNTMLYVKPTTMRETANGYAILTTRANLQRVVSDFYAELKSLLDQYAAQGKFPVNGQWETRVTGLDDTADVGVSGAQPAQLSLLRPRRDHPEWDIAVWFDVLTIPGTPDAQPFYRDLEQWMLATYTGSYAALRPEWSKGWAYSGTGAWADPYMIGTFIPDSYRVGQRAGDDWDTAVATLTRLDPHGVIGNTFLDTLVR